MSSHDDIKSLSITLNGALFGFCASMLLWCLCSAFKVSPIVPEMISNAMVIAALIAIVRRARRAAKR